MHDFNEIFLFYSAVSSINLSDGSWFFSVIHGVITQELHRFDEGRLPTEIAPADVEPMMIAGLWSWRKSPKGSLSTAERG
jgi:hypothetical protein